MINRSIKPSKLSWVTVNLYIYLAISILMIFFSLAGGAFFGALVNSAAETTDDNIVGTILAFVFGIGGVIFFGIAAVLHGIAARGMAQGKRWGWILSMVLMVLNVISYIGTLLLAIPAVLGLVGLLDRDVQDYAKN